jgi:hypothetical protein
LHTAKRAASKSTTPSCNSALCPLFTGALLNAGLMVLPIVRPPLPKHRVAFIEWGEPVMMSGGNLDAYADRDRRRQQHKSEVLAWSGGAAPALVTVSLEIPME